MRRKRVLSLSAAVTLALPAAMLSSSQADAAHFGYNHLNGIQKRLLSGTASVELDPAMAAARAARSAPAQMRSASSSGLCGFDGHGNVRVNQNCLNVTDPDLQGRGQAQNETSIAVDPGNPKRLVASYNDYRRGDGTCGSSYSTDGGRSWRDSTVPNGFTRGDFVGAARQYWQAGGDTSVAWDTRGNAYLACQLFNRGSSVTPNPDQSSAFYVYRSTQNGGASWNFPGRVVAANADTAGAGTALEDKELLTVDASKSSPFRDRVYVTWTLFAADGTAYIYASHSADYGETFTRPVLVSSTSPLCTNTYGIATPRGDCNENQYSQPFTAPDGTLYVVYANFNSSAAPAPPGDDRAAAADNRYQMLISRSTNGGASFSSPVKVGDYYDLPDCATYQGGADEGRACVPEKGPTAHSIFRATNYPSGAVNPKNGDVAVTYGSYINRNSNERNGCVPMGFSPDTGQNLFTGVKRAGSCNNDILVSVSTNRGRSFTGTNTDPRRMPSATDSGRQRVSSQYFQWADFTPDGRLLVSYKDRQYGADEWTGYNDVSLSAWSGSGFRVTRATTSSMPPATGFSGLFWGDYEGLDATSTTAYPFWSDTRHAELFLCPGTGTVRTPPRLCTGSSDIGIQANDEEAVTAGVSLR